MRALQIIKGKVKEGKKRGQAFGFPTANININKKAEEGIYVSLTIVEHKTYQSVAFIGSPKTFDENDFRAESFIFDFYKDIYGKWIVIKLLKKIRNNQKFTSEKELIEQIKKDVLTAREFFQKSF